MLTPPRPRNPSLDQFLSQLISHYPFPMTLKDATSLHYLLANKAAAQLHYLSPEAYQNLNLQALAQCHPFNCNAVAIQQAYDQLVCLTKKSVSCFQIWFNSHGLIRQEIIHKIPVFHQPKLVTAILEFSQNQTLSQGLPSLLMRYQQYYPISQAIQQFLTHIGLASAFYLLPTRRELMTLLQLSRIENSKQAGQQLQIGARTVDLYKEKLRFKLKKRNLRDILIHLRQFYTDKT